MALSLEWTSVQVVLMGILSVVLLLFYLRKSQASKRLPPGPTPWPIFGSLGLLGDLPHQSVAKLAKKYGPLTYMRLGSVPTLFVSSPKFAEEILKTQDVVFASRPSTAASSLMAYNNHDVAFAPYGPHWRYARKVFILELFTQKRLDDFQITRKNEVASILRSILDESEGQKPVQMNEKFSQLTTNVMTWMMMNKGVLGPKIKAQRASREFHENIKRSFILFGVVTIGDFIPYLDWLDLQGYKKKMREAHKMTDSFLQGLLDEHRERHRARAEEANVGQSQDKLYDRSGGPELQDMVDVLISRPPDEDGKILPDDQIKAILLDAVLGGTDTSTGTLEWAMAELIRNPRVVQRAQAELDAVIGRDRLVYESDLPNLPYIEAIVRETLRLHPVGPFLVPRESRTDCEVGGYHIPAKCRVYVNVWAIMRDPTVWDRPLDFYPERFLGSSKDPHGQHFDFLPFGSGRRICPGKGLVSKLAPLTLATLLHACDWTTSPGKRPEDLDMSEVFGLTVPMAVPLEVVATPRLPASVIWGSENP